jgi:hypothetical protein
MAPANRLLFVTGVDPCLDPFGRTRRNHSATSQPLAAAHRAATAAREPFGVFDTILAKAVRLCRANFGILWLTEGDGLRHAELFEPVWNILRTAAASCDYRSAGQGKEILSHKSSDVKSSQKVGSLSHRGGCNRCKDNDFGTDGRATIKVGDVGVNQTDAA